MKHTNRKYRIPRGLHPHRIEEKLIKRNKGGEWIIEREMTMISKDGNQTDGFAPHLLPQQEGNMNGWLIEDGDELERNEADADEEEEEPIEEEEEEPMEEE
ncbi:hypothetical protein Tco_0869420 [Tanacetum coccineum]